MTTGYVVKGTKGPRDVYAYGPGMGFGDACEEIDAHAFERLDAAAGARDHMVRLGCEATIFAVAEDGAETPLPSYEEALAEIERTRAVAPILIAGVPKIMHSSAPATREELGAAACQMLKAIERALSVLRGSEPAPIPAKAAK